MEGITEPEFKDDTFRLSMQKEHYTAGTIAW
jgi:hypothetical protein